MSKWWNVFFETIDQSDSSDLLTVQVEADTPDEGIRLGQERFHSLVLTHNNWQFTDISETSN